MSWGRARRMRARAQQLRRSSLASRQAGGGATTSRDIVLWLVNASACRPPCEPTPRFPSGSTVAEQPLLHKMASSDFDMLGIDAGACEAAAISAASESQHHKGLLLSRQLIQGTGAGEQSVRELRLKALVIIQAESSREGGICRHEPGEGGGGGGRSTHSSSAIIHQAPNASGGHSLAGAEGAALQAHEIFLRLQLCR